MDATHFLSPRWVPHDDLMHPDAGISYATPRLDPSPTSLFLNGVSSSTESHHVALENNDAQASTVTDPGQPVSVLSEAPPNANPTPASRRSKYGRLDWDLHQPHIKKIYLDENKSLSETMKAMQDQHSFKASIKLYKEKIKEWGWSKNLPSHVAEFMVETANKRKRVRGSDTVFSYGGRQWDHKRAQNTLARSKKTRDGNQIQVVETPDGVSYKTPKAPVPSPEEEGPTEDSENENSNAADKKETAVEVVGDGMDLPLRWNGHDRAQLISMWEEGRSCIRNEKQDDAVDFLQQVLAGFTHLSGATNEDAKKVSFELVDLYAQRGSTLDADRVLERMMQAHIDTWGVEDKRTQQHVIHVVELLNSWNRQEDALGLLARSKEILQSDKKRSRRSRNRARCKNKDKAVDSLIDSTQRLEVIGFVDPIDPNATPANIDYRLGVASSHVAAKDHAVESLLNSIISHCEKNPEKLPVQQLRARGELLSLYQKMDMVAAHDTIFQNTPQAINKIWDSFQWDKEKYESIDVMEAYMQVAANMLKSGYVTIVKPLFRKAANKAEILFGPENERAVWVNITIGLAYQTNKGWAEATEWFERAYAGALASDWDDSDGIVRSLDNALEKHHFSYLSDEGRPFKSIFGVTGLIITPNRLHLE